MRPEPLSRPGADPMVPVRCRIVRRREDCAGVATLTIEPVDEPLPCPAPGQFNMLYAFGIGEAAISVSGIDERGRTMHTIRAAGATTRALTMLAPGAVIGARGPFGAGWPVAGQAGRELLCIAGGLGLAPLRPAILAAMAGRGVADAPVSVIYGTRSPDMVLYERDLGEWAGSGRASLAITVDHAAPGWTGRVGVVTACLPQALAGRDPRRVSAFVCGPEVMMRFTAQALCDAGVAPGRIWLSMERNMKCGIGFCGHCQYGPDFICRDGPVLRYNRIAGRLGLREI